MKKITAENVLVDLEGTITDDASENEFINDPDLKGDSFGGILRRMLAEKFRISYPDALKMVKEVTAPCGWIDPFYAISHSDWGISEDKMWEEILKWQDKHLLIFRDAVDMVEELYRKNFTLYMVSNCSRIVVLSQLNTAGLAERAHSSFFRQIYGCFDLGFQKSDPQVYKKILGIESLNRERTVMVGNEPGIDLEPAKKAGIPYSIIVDRTQSAPVEIRDGGIFVRSLKVVPELLEPSF